MDPDKKDEVIVSPEEQTAEEEATKEVQDEELRAKVAEDLGVDPEDEDQKELLDKIVAREKSHREKLSGAIKQKISWREKVQKASGKPKDKPEDGKGQDKETPNVDELVDRKVDERLEARDLETLDLPDELKEEVKKLAKLKGISVRAASQDPYIKFKKDEMDREARITAATPKRSNKGSYTPSVDPSKPLNPADFDFNTEEGRKAWNDAKAARRKHEAQQ